MWKVYFKVYGATMSGAAILKLAADFLNFVGPLSVGGITLYVTNIIYFADQQPEVVSIMYSYFDRFCPCGLLMIKIILFGFKEPEFGTRFKEPEFDTIRI